MRRLLKEDGTYDRAAIVARANVQFRDARRIGLEWDRAKCLSYVWRQARAQRAQWLGVALSPPRARKVPTLGSKRQARGKVSRFPAGLSRL